MNVECGRETFCADLGNSGRQRKLTINAEERAIGVLADPVALKELGAAAPLLAVVNEKCANSENCRLKYSEVAELVGVSMTSVKGWADTLERLGYFTRQPCGPAGVEIRLSPEKWPSRRTGTAMADAANSIVELLNAVRLTIDSAIGSAVVAVRQVQAEAA